MKYYLGIDIGSTTCKAVVIDELERIVNKVVVPIVSQPIETINDVLEKIKYNEWKFNNIGVTGSSRNLVAKYLKTTFVKSEIISHTYATMKQQGDVKTIIEIGGQDSKFISLQNGIISEFKMNSVCAAGTGSFLQWQAGKLGISMEEFDELSMRSKKKIDVNGRCTVFIESALINLKRMGETREDIAYAICRCLVNNYISEMCKIENLQEPIVFQGGVAKLCGMKKAFEEVLGKEVMVYEDCQFMGAIGVALLSMKENSEKTIDPHIEKMERYTKELLVCKDCQRECDIIKYIFEENGESFIVGGKCGKY